MLYSRRYPKKSVETLGEKDESLTEEVKAPVVVIDPKLEKKILAEVKKVEGLITLHSKHEAGETLKKGEIKLLKEAGFVA